MEYLKSPKNMTLQWHVTERCNWKCKHCYQDDSIKDEMTLPELLEVLDQYISLLKIWRIPRHAARLNISGGEPLLRKDIYEFLEKVSKHSDYYIWTMMSNGSLITQEIAKRLKSLGIGQVQVSIEGLKENNDNIRGIGSYEKILKAIRILSKEGVRTNVSMTLTRQNISDVPELCDVLMKSGARQINTRRLVPIGRGSDLEMIESSKLRSYYQQVQELNSKFKQKFNIYIGCESSIFNDETNGVKYDCGLYQGRILIVMQNGDILPCRRLPVKIGNTKEQTLFEVWYNSDLYQDLRNIDNAHDTCKQCNNFNQCFGGAKCVTYAQTGKLYIPDVQCWKVH